MDSSNTLASNADPLSQTVRSTLAIPDFSVRNNLHEELDDSNVASTPIRGRSRTLSQLAPSIITPANEKPPVDVATLANLTSNNSFKPDRARQEARKLISHIINELQNRPRPPPVWDVLRSVYAAQQQGPSILALKAGFKIGSGHGVRTGSFADSDSEDESSPLFSPDVTFDLLNRLKDVLVLAKLKSWHIFADDAANITVASRTEWTEKSPSFRFRRSSFNSGNKRARSFSPNASKRPSCDVLSQCINILSSIILEDCRFQIRSIRLVRPPNALQALTLDITQLLAYMHRGNARTLYDIGLSVMPAFSTFPGSMHKRLLIFFEDSLLRSMLHILRGIQNHSTTPLDKYANQDDHDNIPEQPIVAIQVDEAQDDSFTALHSPEDWDRWVPSNADFRGILSSYAPAQSLDAYYLSSVVGPLLTAILDNVDLLTQDLVLSHRLQSFFCFLADYKADVAVDLLQVVAYHSTRSRHFAISLLLTYWPKAIGHLSISKPFPILSHTYTLRKTGLVRDDQNEIHPHFHQFVPWHFNPIASSAIFEGSSSQDCQSCRKQITDFGLLCPFCMCSVHFNCYDAPDGNHLSHYPVSDEPSTQRVAVHRYSCIRPRRLGFEPAIVRKGQHVFRLVNIFTLSLCGMCRRPLWGHIAQGYRCGACNQYVHHACMNGKASGQLPHCHSEPDTSRITVNWTDLRSSFIDFYRDILFNEEDISRCTFEEVATFWSLLWIQLQLLKYGIASGSIIVMRDRSSFLDSQAGVDNFELQHLEKLYYAYLTSDRLSIAPIVQDLLQKNGYARQLRCLLFEWPILVYAVSLIKSPLSSEDDATCDLLHVASSSREDGTAGDTSLHAAEVVSLAHARDVLGRYFGLHKPQAACIMLGHLRHVGFFECSELPDGFFTACERPGESRCLFSLPLGLDISANVETLVLAIETCLEDLDISVNESGFLLLNRKLWPNGMASDYALARLMRAVLAWILSEDDNLVIIMREFVAKGKHLPGVPSSDETHSWPNNNPSRSTSSGSVNNGNDYVACRKSLLEKYATPWLFAIHCQDPNSYTRLVFETITDLAMDSLEASIAQESSDENETLSLCADKVLRSIMKICQSSIAFSVVDDLFLKWLMVFPNSLPAWKPLPTLPRLFNRDIEGTSRYTSAFDATITSFEHMHAPLLDPWRVVIGVAAHDYNGLKKGLGWLCIFASSGVDIPVNTFLQMSALARDLGATFEDHVTLGESAFMAIWIKSLGRQELQKLISDLHDRHANYILAHLGLEENSIQIYRFFRLTLSSFLLLYGCERPRLQDLGLVEASDIGGLSRRKAAKRASLTTELSVDDFDFIEILARYMEEGTDGLRCLIVKFLTCFVTESSLLSMHELEAIILRNSFFLTRCVWKMYDMQTPVVNDLRTTLLLRLLVVDTRHFDDLLQENFNANDHWETRLSAATKLFQIILDIAKPSFSVEGRQWRSSVMGILSHFFSCLWSSDQEEIRLATDSWAQTLQSVHQQTMTLCFSEYLSHAPIAERLDFVSFLLQLRSHFPTWKVLAWDAIIEMLMDDDFMQRTDADESAISAHLSMYGISSKRTVEASQIKDPDLSVLQSSLILLSLEMIADGIQIDIFSYLKIKMQLVTLAGFSGTTLVPAPSGHSFHVQFGELKYLNPSVLPCLQGLMVLMDACRPFELAPSAMTANGAEDDTAYPCLVGSVVLDVFLGIFNYLLDNCMEFSGPQMKIMLQSLIIVIYKHDVEIVPLRHVREVVRRIVKRISELLLKDIGNEAKQLVLTSIQAYRKRWLNYASSRDLLVQQVSDIMKFVSTSTAKDGVLVGQAMSAIEDILTTHSGTFYNLCKQPLKDDTFAILRLVFARNARNIDANGSLPDFILKDTLQYLVSVQNDSGRKCIFDNLKTYIEVVHHQGYYSENLAYVGECITTILRNASELLDEGFNPNPLLLAAATLIQYNKAQIRSLLSHLETALRIALVRFDVSEQSLRRLLQVTSSLYRRTASEPGSSLHERNSILAVIIDVLSDGFRGKCRVTPLTLKTIADSLCKPGHMYLSGPSLGRLASDGLFFLQSSGSSDGQSQHSLQAPRAASLVVIRAEGHNKGYLHRYFGENPPERGIRQGLTVRAWNALVLETLLSNPETRIATQLFKNLSNFSATYDTSLRAHIQCIGIPADMTASDINQGFIAIKLWLLLARKCSEEVYIVGDNTISSEADHATEDRNAYLVWNELWPPFERLASLSEADVEVGDVSPIATLVWSSVADILLFLRSMRSVISLESAPHIATLNRVKSIAKGESFSGKFARTLKSISEPPAQLPVSALIAQVTQEMLAAEKLHALETRRELGRMLPDRSRRDLRMPTT